MNSVTKKISIRYYTKLTDGTSGTVEVETSLTREYPEGCDDAKKRAEFDQKLAKRSLAETMADIEQACSSDVFIKKVIDDARKTAQ